MKAKLIVILVLFVICSLRSYALDTMLFDIRNTFFKESKEIKALMSPQSQETALITSLWDTCILTITQIDAYFSMLGVFNSVKEKNLNKTSTDVLMSWLNEIKRTNDLNLENLNSLQLPEKSRLQSSVERLKIYFSELNGIIGMELKKVDAVKRTLKKAS